MASYCETDLLTSCDVKTIRRHLTKGTELFINNHSLSKYECFKKLKLTNRMAIISRDATVSITARHVPSKPVAV